ncbi:MAG: tetratricopeptide repeat protein, partial [Thermoanaerobaculia bacterium]|nr:tetratricopeptide repeat protein [Thermoanaerobaculia bacterium]
MKGFYASLAAILLAPALFAAESREEALFRHRNLGKAFYENPATQYDAVGEFKKALELAPDSARERVNYGLSLMRAGKPEEGIAELEKAQKQDPSIPHTWFNLGIAYKNASRYPEAIAQLEKLVQLAPDEAIAYYNLGVLYKLAGKAEPSLAAFERSARLDPNLAGPHFQLATAYRQAKRLDESKKAMETFREIKARNAEAAVPEDLEWSYYSEIYETIDPKQAADSGPPAAWQLEPKTLAKGSTRRALGPDRRWMPMADGKIR